MIICLAVDCQSDSRQGQAGLDFYKFPKDKNLKRQWLIKVKHKNIQSIQHVIMCHGYCFG